MGIFAQKFETFDYRRLPNFKHAANSGQHSNWPFFTSQNRGVAKI